MPAVVNRYQYEASMTGFRTILEEGLAKADVAIDRFVTKSNSTGDKETYTSLGAGPKMAEWLSDREHSRLRADGYTVENQDFATGIEVSANDIDDDKLGLLGVRHRRLAESYEFHLLDLVFGAINNGFASLCYDGQFFFDTDHPPPGGGSATQSNKAVAVLSAGAIYTAKTSMARLQDENGQQVGARPDVLVVPPELEQTAQGIVEAEALASGASNTLYKALDLVVTPRITSATAWFLLDTSRSLRPLILQTRRPVEIHQQGIDSEHFYMRRDVRTGIDWRGNIAYAMWQMAYGSTGAGS